MNKLYPLISAVALLGLTAAASVPAMAASTPSAETVYVATTGSDVTGNGTSASPYATIQKALANVASGGTVMVEPGTYSGTGTAEAIPLTSGDTAVVNITQPVTVEAAAGATGAVVIDATGDANGVYIDSSGVTVEGLTIKNANNAGLLAMGKGPLTNLTIQNNVVEDNAQVAPPKGGDWEALHLIGVQNSSIIGNTVTNNKDGGLYLTDETAPSTGNLIADNTVTNNAVDCGITLASHVGGHGVNNNLVVGNTATGNGAAGVILATPVPGGSVSNNVIEGNTVSGNNYGGITLHTHAPGSQVNGNVIADNTIGRNVDFLDLGYTAGVDLFAAGSPISNTVIEGNTITGDYYGVAVTPWLSQGTVVQNNTYTKDGFGAPNWLTYQALVTGPTGAASIATGLLGKSWTPMQIDLAALVDAGVKTNAQYLGLLHGHGSLHNVAEQLYHNYHVYK